MNPTIKFLKSKFSDYYSTTAIRFPERFTKREWGFMFIGETFMQRHQAFHKSSELVKFLSGGSGSQTAVPAHVYYSSAYYNEPGLQPMQAKVDGWLGADLIFDLDDDHLRNIEGLSYDERLAKVKDIVVHKLLDDYILGDFGFEAKFIKIAFSGSRGYHIHVNDPKVLSMSSAARREIVDYLIGVGLNLDRILPMEVFDSKEYGGRKYSKKPKVVTPKLTAPGWKGRMARGILNLLTRLSKMPDEEAIAELTRVCGNLKIKNKKVKEKDITDLYNELFSRPGVKYNKETFDQRNVLEIFSRDWLRDIFLGIVKPTSLHGKTGLQVVPLTIDKLADFEPLRDAVAFGSEPMKIKVSVEKEFSFKLGGEAFSVEPGSVELPEFAAIYLICQRKAVLV
jgi:DNA primase small subunit